MKITTEEAAEQMIKSGLEHASNTALNEMRGRLLTHYHHLKNTQTNELNLPITPEGWRVLNLLEKFTEETIKRIND
tara:strand:- start:1110 stop:1337 length:228 start_codon:yes stop_codon:yes gene_type:complete